MTDPRTPGMDDLADAAAAEARAAAADAAAEQAAAENAGADDASADPLADARRALAEQQDKYLRLYAEFENFRKRAVRDRQDAEHRGMGAVMKGLLETLDDLGRVAHMTPEGTAAQQVIEGIEMVEKKLLKSLAGHGLEVVNPVDARFDPSKHEAITTMPAASADEDEMVAQVYQVGYLLNGTLLRPARVVVKQWNG
ncbi:MAG: nucleotide exchange factor GrpE [Gemmatimonadaceae bacterium]|nr:nucleotide exchange factor GrpE [Gemmatimonadaceae bacterium]MCW5826250.1 nucleotide exchange factor GrpE [Gemmatimonadaceae bacterium]